MRSATVRRFALVAAVVLLAPVWARQAPTARVVQGVESALVGAVAADGTLAAPATATPGAALRRQAGAGWGLSGTRADHGRAVAALALVALLSLLRPAPWARLRAAREAPSSLVRRRFAIALRAPPLPSCT
jgi:hypothetical protein